MSKDVEAALADKLRALILQDAERVAVVEATEYLTREQQLPGA